MYYKPYGGTFTILPGAAGGCNPWPSGWPSGAADDGEHRQIVEGISVALDQRDIAGWGEDGGTLYHLVI